MTPKGILPVEEIAGGLKIVGTGNIDGESAPKQREQVFTHLRHHTPILLDVIRGPPVQEFLTNERELMAARILERELVAPAEDLAID